MEVIDRLIMEFTTRFTTDGDKLVQTTQQFLHTVMAVEMQCAKRFLPFPDILTEKEKSAAELDITIFHRRPRRDKEATFN
jgi:hypothetical protein